MISGKLKLSQYSSTFCLMDFSVCLFFGVTEVEGEDDEWGSSLFASMRGGD